MTGLDKIIEQIRQDAQQTVDRNLQEAKNTAKEILAEGKRRARQQAEEIEEKSRQEAEDLTDRLQSAAQLEYRKRLLNAKQSLIGEVIEEAKQSLYRLPDQEYFDLLARMVQAYALGQPGELKLSQNDRKRMPADFEKCIASGLAAGGSLRLSQQTADIDGGFVLVYGGIEENCSFEAMFESSKEKLQDRVQALLFEA